MLEARDVRLQQQLGRETRTPYLPGYRRHYQPDSHPSRKTRALLMIMVLACFVMALAVIVQYSRMVGVSREIYRTENRIEQTVEENQALEREIARLSSAERIETIAREEIGMRTPESSQLYLLSRDIGGDAEERSVGED